MAVACGVADYELESNLYQQDYLWLQSDHSLSVNALITLAFALITFVIFCLACLRAYANPT